jgi:putative polymerase
MENAAPSLSHTTATKWTPSPMGPALLVSAAVLYNFLLCFVDTNIHGLGVKVVVVCEVAIIGMAFGMIWHLSRTLYVVVLLIAIYFFTFMVLRSEFDPKILRDVLIPIAFVLLGNHLGSLRSADRLVTFLILIAFSVALFEWLALNTYLHYFDVIKYYVSRGTEVNLASDSVSGVFIKSSDSTAGLYINGKRLEDRTLLPFLGEHRVSGIFLEPVSAGNFGVIAFAWILLRENRLWPFIGKSLTIGTILVLADARFGLYLSLFLLVIYLVAPVIRPTMLFLAPFCMMLALLSYAAVGSLARADNTLGGRVLAAGNSLANLDPLEVFGLHTSNFFISGYAGDSGYGYALVKLGLVGLVAIWALFVYTPDADKAAWRFKNFLAFYVVSLLAISASLFSIKTAALVWFLYGTLNNPRRAV